MQSPGSLKLWANSCNRWTAAAAAQEQHDAGKSRCLTQSQTSSTVWAVLWYITPTGKQTEGEVGTLPYVLLSLCISKQECTRTSKPEVLNHRRLKVTGTNNKQRNTVVIMMPLTTSPEPVRLYFIMEGLIDVLIFRPPLYRASPPILSPQKLPSENTMNASLYSSERNGSKNISQTKMWHRRWDHNTTFYHNFNSK